MEQPTVTPKSGAVSAFWPLHIHHFADPAAAMMPSFFLLTYLKIVHDLFLKGAGIALLWRERIALTFFSAAFSSLPAVPKKLDWAKIGESLRDLLYDVRSIGGGDEVFSADNDTGGSLRTAGN